jgi:glycosyltransferase involved in cell wall biosynthesis
VIVEHDFSDRSVKSINYLIKIIDKYDIAYIYLTDKPFFDWMYFVMRLKGIKRIIDHDHTPGERTPVSSFKKIIKKLIHDLRLFSCDHYIGVSNFVRNRAIQIACVPEDRCSFIHNGIRIFDNTKTEYAHNVFSIPLDCKIIVSTGRAVYYKGIDTLLKSAHILIRKENIEDIYFLFVGNGPDLDKFKKLAEELDIGDKFIFAGYRTDVQKILPSCNIGVQVSLGEAFSLSIIEYMCAALFTLAPNNCGNSEAITDGVNGLLFVPGNVNDLVDKIKYSLDNEDISRSMGAAARKSVIENFTIEECSKKLISLLDSQFV